MTEKEKVYGFLKEYGDWAGIAKIMSSCNISNRTYLSRILAGFVKQGKVMLKKEGRNTLYRYRDYELICDEQIDLTATREEEVWGKIRNSESIQRATEQAQDIFRFAFTEMLNNAIEHSKSGVGHVKVWADRGVLEFSIRDFGVGIFQSVMTKKRLESEIEAVQEILKGKLTTDPARHSGEGIFWTNKIADRMSIASYRYELIIDNIIGDFAIQKLDEALVGTEVKFEIEGSTNKSMSALFHRYSSDEKMTLDTTVIPVKLYEVDDAWVSRSQARRVLQGLERYKRIVFDFKGIKLIGQGFADEIFRVFQIAHPDIVLEAINMGETVRLLVERAKNDPTGRE